MNIEMYITTVGDSYAKGTVVVETTMVYEIRGEFNPRKDGIGKSYPYTVRTAVGPEDIPRRYGTFDGLVREVSDETMRLFRLELEKANQERVKKELDQMVDEIIR